MNGLECAAIARATLGEPAKRQGAELLWLCPRHDDKHPSLQVNPSKDVWLCGPCGSGGNPWQLAAFIAGLNPDDKAAVAAWLRQRGLLEANDHGGERRIVAEYDYRDENGKVLFQTVRYQPKDFRQRRPDGKGGWIWNLDGVSLVPYRLPQWNDKPTVYLVEGEKDADALWKLDLPATCNPMAAGKWREQYNPWLKGKRVVIFPDNDPPGEAHALDVARHLLPVAVAVKIVRLPGLPAKGDVSDWLAAGGTREKLGELVKAAPWVTVADLAEAIEEHASGSHDIAACDEIKRAVELAEYAPFRHVVTHFGISQEEYDPRKFEAAFSSMEHLRTFVRQRGSIVPPPLPPGKCRCP